MKPPSLAINAHGQIIAGPDAAHFMHAESGRKSGFAIVPVNMSLIFEHKQGKLPKRAQAVGMFDFLAVHRSHGRCLKAARHIATFFQN